MNSTHLFTIKTQRIRKEQTSGKVSEDPKTFNMKELKLDFLLSNVCCLQSAKVDFEA